jgi:uncharacterized membrane protein YraQ (UPF0718 family)
VNDILMNFIDLFTESAPFLLMGLLLAGMIRLLIPDKWINKVLGKDSSVVTAAIIGTPLPLCSCSVIPAAIGIRRAGASKASTASFMVATPETGVDSIGVTFALMGPIMAVARPVAAITSAIVAGTLVRLWDVETPPKQEPVTSCCHSDSESKDSNEVIEQESWVAKAKAVFQYGYGQLLGDFMSWLLVGLFFAALIQTFVPASFLTEYGSGVFAMMIIVLISIPMYICATASTPIAAGMMLSGISPGAALVFMLAGPATNIATLMVVKNELGIRSLMGYLTGLVTTAVIMGLGFDWMLNAYDINIAVTMGDHGEMTSTLYSISAVILAALIIVQYSKKLTVYYQSSKLKKRLFGNK